MTAIEVRNVWKKYRLYYDKSSTLKEKVLFRNRRRFEERWVLQGIDLSLEKGEAVGLIGENGSGKSTLLKLMSKIAYPDKGDIIINGKVSSLLELGAGFHPDLTGRENIYMNASIFGLTREQIDRRLSSIVSFSEMENYIDNPVRTYSSGMYMRLAFSVAINVEADILLIDEILAVGDLNFQNKCFQRMQQLKKNGVTIVLVSHDLDSVEKLCSKAIWLNEGRIEAAGDSLTVSKQYLHYMRAKGEDAMLLGSGEAAGENHGQEQTQQLQGDGESTEQHAEYVEIDQQTGLKRRWGNNWVVITNVELTGRDGKRHLHFQTEDPMTINIQYKVNKRPETIGFGFAINRVDGIYCYGTNTFIDNVEIKAHELPGEGQITIHIDKLNLVAGSYSLDVAVHDKDGLAFDYRKGLMEFGVFSDIKDEGLLRLPHTWSVG